MKVLITDAAKCTGCGVCESVCSTLWHREDDAEKSCIRVKKDDERAVTVCSQCGECIPVCPGNALKRDNNGVVRLDKNKCVGCFVCVGYCPTLAMGMHKDYLQPFKCVACGQCAKSCPSGAISIKESGEQ